MCAEHHGKRCGGRGHQATLRVAALVLLALAASAWAQVRYAGRPLASVLDELRRGGLPIVYSTALVRQELVVGAEPGAGEPRTVLEKILSQHGLTAREGRGGELVVVAAPVPPSGSIHGRIESEIGTALADTVVVRVVGTSLAAPVADDGRFELGAVPAGEHAIVAESPLFGPMRPEPVVVRPGETARVRLRLEPVPRFLSEIVVTPSHLRIEGEQPETRMPVSHEELERMPHAGDDLLRAVRQVPGVAGGDYSARVNVRGGEEDEVLVLLDGLELYEPFHFKDFQNLFSTIDSTAAGAVDVLTAGFPVEYGDRMSGVMDISIATPEPANTTSVTVGTLHTRVLTQGSFAGERGRWLACARGWYPDALVDIAAESTDEKVDTDYFDVLAKVQYSLGDRSLLSTDVLWAYDDLRFADTHQEETETVAAAYRSHHLWLTLHTILGEDAFFETLLAGGRSTRRRVGGFDDTVEGTLDVDDRRELGFFSLRQDWQRQRADRHLFKAGLEVRSAKATYRYRSERVTADPAVFGNGPPVVDVITTDLAEKGQAYGFYAADRIRLADTLVVELGARWDRQTWVDDQQLSPRANLMYAAGARTTLRAAWGRFWQSQRLNELQVEDGVTAFYPAQLAEHIVASVEHRLDAGVMLRVEGYEKRLVRLRPRFENLFDPLELFPEARSDRVAVAPAGALTRGLEVTARSAGGGRTGWWASYGLARAEDEIGGETVPRSWDQRHTVSLGASVTLPGGWSASLGGAYHTGWPTTQVTGEVVGEENGEPVVALVAGPRNRLRFPAYLRLDLRAQKRLVVRHGELDLMLEVLNLTNRSNRCCVEDFLTDVTDTGAVTVVPEYGNWAPIVPSLSLRWTF